MFGKKKTKKQKSKCAGCSFCSAGEICQSEFKNSANGLCVGGEKLLSNFAIGESGVVKNVNGCGKLRRRLFDMGVTPGAEILLRKKAPLGDPIEIKIRGYLLTLRKSEAELVLMEGK